MKTAGVGSILVGNRTQWGWHKAGAAAGWSLFGSWGAGLAACGALDPARQGWGEAGSPVVARADSQSGPRADSGQSRGRGSQHGRHEDLWGAWDSVVRPIQFLLVCGSSRPASTSASTPVDQGVDGA